MITHSSDVKSVLVKYFEDSLEFLDMNLYQTALDAIDGYKRGPRSAYEDFKFAVFMQGMEYGLRVAEEVVDHLHCMNCGEPDYKPTGAEFEEAVSEYLEALGGG
jgi:hypothetical protein